MNGTIFGFLASEALWCVCQTRKLLLYRSFLWNSRTKVHDKMTPSIQLLWDTVLECSRGRRKCCMPQARLHLFRYSETGNRNTLSAKTIYSTNSKSRIFCCSSSSGRCMMERAQLAGLGCMHAFAPIAETQLVPARCICCVIEVIE